MTYYCNSGEFSLQERTLIQTAFNEICHGLPLSEQEFERQIGYSPDKARLLLEALNRHTEDAITFSQEEISLISAVLNVISNAFSEQELLIRTVHSKETVDLLVRKVDRMAETFFSTKWTYRLEAKPTTLAFSSDSKTVLIGDQQGSIHVFDLQTGTLVLKHSEGRGSILALYLQDQLLYSFDSAGHLIQRSFPDMQTLQAFTFDLPKKTSFYSNVEKEREFSHALFRPKDFALIVVISEEGFYMRNSELFEKDLRNLAHFDIHFDPTDLGKSCTLPYADADNQIDALALSKDGCQFLVTSCTSAGTSDWDWAYGCPEYISIFGDHVIEHCCDDGRAPPYHKRNVAAFSLDRKQVLITSSDYEFLSILDFSDRSEVTNTISGDGGEWPKLIDIDYHFESSAAIAIASPSSSIQSLDWASTGDLFAIGGSNGAIVFFDRLEIGPVWRKKIFETAVEHLMFSPDGGYCVFLSQAGEIAVMVKSSAFLKTSDESRSIMDRHGDEA